MLYPILSLIFILTILICVLFFIGFLLKPRAWRENIFKIKVFFVFWSVSYSIFIFFFTGPEDLNKYPKADSSPYKLPWAAGVRRFVAQGNRSFTSHRDSHLVAWDFVMPIGTPVLAAREGIITHVEVDHHGFQLFANYIAITHSDNDQTWYAHLKNDGAVVKVGDHVQQGQVIGFSGRVGMALFPHLHFNSIGADGASKPLSFKEVPGGIPFAGHFYTSENAAQ